MKKKIDSIAGKNNLFSPRHKKIDLYEKNISKVSYDRKLRMGEDYLVYYDTWSSYQLWLKLDMGRLLGWLLWKTDDKKYYLDCIDLISYEN